MEAVINVESKNRFLTDPPSAGNLDYNERLVNDGNVNLIINQLHLG